jgi:alpha-methylacyl-CoA racemase
MNPIHPAPPASPRPSLPGVLAGLRILSLALNLPGPAALMRAQAMGARCLKLEPPEGDPMQAYSPEAYSQLHQGMEVERIDLKSGPGQARLAQALSDTDVVLTSFRPSALARLGLDWPTLHARYPALSLVAIVGDPEAPEVPGHDLTYQAEHDLVTGLSLPPTLYADMGGALQASEALLQAALLRQAGQPGRRFDVGLAGAAAFLALPRRWGLTQATGLIGGAHAGYQVYACQDGRVAVAALEPHFMQRLCDAAGLPAQSSPTAADTQAAAARWFLTLTRAELDALARALDLPLHTLPDTGTSGRR